MEQPGSWATAEIAMHTLLLKCQDNRRSLLLPQGRATHVAWLRVKFCAGVRAGPTRDCIRACILHCQNTAVGSLTAFRILCRAGQTAPGSSSDVPVEVEGGFSLASISAGSSHTCGVQANGQAVCWGKGGKTLSVLRVRCGALIVQIK